MSDTANNARRLTKRQRELMERYTFTERVLGMYNVKIKVGAQSFTLFPLVNTKRKREPVWFRKMLAVALDNLIKAEARP